MRIEFNPDPRLYPFTSRWFDTSAGRLHYIDEGEGPPIVFCHGNPTWSFLYRGIVSRLRHRFRCIAVDYHGFGLSEHPAGYGYTIAEHARTTGELLDHLQLDGFHVMGQDWGGPISLSVATERHDRVAGIVLGNTWFWPPSFSLRLFSRFMSTGVMQGKIINDNFFVERIMPISSSRRLTELEKAHYRRVQPFPAARRGVAMMPKQIVGATALLERLSREVPEKLGSKPALITWGMKDLGFRPRMMRRVRSAFEDVVVLKLPHAGHYVQEDAPSEIARAIEERFGSRS